MMMDMSHNGTLPVVDGQRITLRSMEEALSAIAHDAAHGMPFSVFTLNLDHLVKRRRDPAFRSAYARARHVTADGWPVAWLARRSAGLPVDRVTGADMLRPLCEIAAVLDLPVAFVGSTPEVLMEATARLRETAAGLKVVARISPPFGFDPAGPAAAHLIEDIRKSGARLCFLALGAPKQELLADRAVSAGVECGFICVGAAVDFAAGAQKRAPAWMRGAGLEWAWRLMTDPARMTGRYAASAAVLARILWESLTGTGPVHPGGKRP